MKNPVITIGLCLLPLGVGAQSLIETFNYGTGAIGSSAATGTGLTGNWAFTNTAGANFSGAASGAVVNNAAFTAPANYAFTPSNNQFSVTGGNAYAALSSSIPTNVNGTYYLSFFQRLSQGGNVASSFFNVGLTSTQTNNADYFNFSKGSTSTTFGLKFGLDSLENSGVSIEANTDYFVVLKLDILAEGTDSLSFNVYTSSDTLPSAAPVTWDFTSTAALEGSFTGIALRAGSAQTLQVDEIRLGTSWDQVATAIPEPSAFGALAGLAVLGLAATRRRRA